MINRLALILLCALGLNACAYLNSPIKRVGAGPVCSLSEDKATLTLRGATNEAMLACIESVQQAPITTINIDSHGGSVRDSIAIGEILARYDATLIVSGNCNSSCLNYFVPVVRKLKVLPDAILLSHGGIDFGFVEMVINRDALPVESATVKRIQGTAQRQGDYAQRHNIAPGWLIQRSALEYKTPSMGQYISGELEIWGGLEDVKVRYFLFEPDFIKSCLPDLELDWPEQGQVELARNNMKTQRRFAKAGIFPTSDMRCITP